MLVSGCRAQALECAGAVVGACELSGCHTWTQRAGSLAGVRAYFPTVCGILVP